MDCFKEKVNYRSPEDEILWWVITSALLYYLMRSGWPKETLICFPMLSVKTGCFGGIMGETLGKKCGALKKDYISVITYNLFNVIDKRNYEK